MIHNSPESAGGFEINIQLNDCEAQSDLHR